VILGIDIGNTNITIGFAKEKKVLISWRLNTREHRTPDEFMMIFTQLLSSSDIKKTDVQHTVISSVVPPILSAVSTAVKQLFSIVPFIVKPGIRINMEVKYQRPQDVGSDRIVNAVAVKHLYGYPAIILDFGTATTLCVLDKKGDYSGGVIFPGTQIIADALYRLAAMLPRVAFEDPKYIIGNSTTKSIQSGLYYGTQEMLKGMIRQIKKEIDVVTPVIATGGLAKTYAQTCNFITNFEPDLTLIGLSIIHDLNTQKQADCHHWETV